MQRMVNLSKAMDLTDQVMVNLQNHLEFAFRDLVKSL
jgi:plasmid maintenance system antidote protein VapI